MQGRSLSRIKSGGRVTGYNMGMANDKAGFPPARSAWSVVMLLALVLAITAQLITGFTMMAAFSTTLLMTHIGVGIAAIALTIAEWLWLLATPAGTYRLRGFFAAGSGPAEWSEAAFLIVASVTVIVGAVLAAAPYLGAALPFAAVLSIHQALATAVAMLYVVHAALATYRAGAKHRSAA